MSESLRRKCHRQKGLHHCAAAQGLGGSHRDRVFHKWWGPVDHCHGLSSMCPQRNVPYPGHLGRTLEGRQHTRRSRSRSGSWTAPWPSSSGWTWLSPPRLGPPASGRPLLSSAARIRAASRHGPSTRISWARLPAAARLPTATWLPAAARLSAWAWVPARTRVPAWARVSARARVCRGPASTGISWGPTSGLPGSPACSDRRAKTVP